MRYETPSIEISELDTIDVITASVTSNGQGSITSGDRTIEGEEGTFSALFGDLL